MRERLIGAQVKAHPAASVKQDAASHCLMKDDVHPYRKRRGKHAVMAKLNGHSGLFVGVK